jgi:pimeloyl-ACP methyl ester carboxylesterase
MATDIRTLTTPDGRQLEYLVTGPDDGPALLLHSGTPSTAVDFSDVLGPATALGLRAISYSRPGYGTSTERPGRSVADAVEDVTAVLDELGIREFRTVGWSGGGPHALACGALLPDRCRAVTALASLAPYAASGLDFLAGMEEDNREEWAAAAAGLDALAAHISPFRAHFQEVTAASLAEGMEGAVSAPDLAALTGTFAEELAAAFRRSMETGIAGWRDDDLAFVRGWGFALSAVAVPVALWYGREDWIVPFAHGEWLGGAIPGAVAHRLDHDGHLSLIRHFDAILAELITLGG